MKYTNRDKIEWCNKMIEHLNKDCAYLCVLLRHHNIIDNRTFSISYKELYLIFPEFFTSLEKIKTNHIRGTRKYNREVSDEVWQGNNKKSRIRFLNKLIKSLTLNQNKCKH